MSASEPTHEPQALEIPSSHAAIRSFGSLVAVFVAVGLFEAALFVPAVSRMLGVTVMDGLVAVVLTAVGTTIATLTYRITGPSRIYLRAEYGESVLAACGYSFLIYASGSPHSFLWFIYLVHCFGFASTGTNLRNSVLIGAAPTAVALSFGVQGQVAAAVISLVAGGFGLMLYLMLAKAFDELEAARRRETELKATLAELSVAQERDRIARDLQESIGAQLAALASRVRGFASGSGRPLTPAELEALEGRVLATVEELRGVVLALRQPSASAHET